MSIIINSKKISIFYSSISIGAALSIGSFAMPALTTGTGGLVGEVQKELLAQEEQRVAIATAQKIVEKLEASSVKSEGSAVLKELISEAQKLFNKGQDLRDQLINATNPAKRHELSKKIAEHTIEVKKIMERLAAFVKSFSG